MPTLVELEQLLDIALTTPEIGTVNFNILRVFLQEILKHLNIETKVIDIDDLSGELKSAYDFIKDGFVEIIKSPESRGRTPLSVQKPKLVVETEPDEQMTKEQGEEEQSKSETPALVVEESKSQASVNSPGSQELKDSTPKPGTALSVRDTTPVTRSSVMLLGRSDSFKNLKRRVSELEERLESLEAQPTPVPDPVRSAASLVRKESRTPAHDFVELINIKRKLEASENSVEGLTEMVDALTSDVNELKETMPSVNNVSRDVTADIEELKNGLNALKEEKNQGEHQSGETSKQLDKLAHNEQRLDGLESLIANLKEAMDELKNTQSSKEPVQCLNEKDQESSSSEVSKALQKIETHEKQLQELAAQIQVIEGKIEETDAKSSATEQAASDALVRLEVCGEGVNGIRESLEALNKELKDHKSLIEDNEMQIHQLKNTMTLLQRESLERVNEEAEKE